MIDHLCLLYGLTVMSRLAFVRDCVRSFISEFGENWFFFTWDPCFTDVAEVAGVVDMKGFTWADVFLGVDGAALRWVLRPAIV